VIAKTKRVRYHDHGVDQLDSATNGFTANFSYQP
jgi:hypothetical protein